MTDSLTTIILSSFENTSTDKFRVAKRFPTPYTSTHDEIGLQSVSLYNSWFNISPSFNNQDLSYIWTNGVTYNISLPAGSYTLDNISDYIQFAMVQNKHYLIDENKQNVFYIKLEVNPVYYSIILTLTPLPAKLPTGWTLPSGATWSLNDGTVGTDPNKLGITPRLVIGNNNFGKVIGFANNGTYPSTPETTVQQISSSRPPIISPITSINIACNWVNDTRFNSMPNIIGSFIPDAGTGELISKTPPFLSMYPVTQNQYTGIEITFLDQEFRPLMLNDTDQIQIELALRTTYPGGNRA